MAHLPPGGRKEIPIDGERNSSQRTVDETNKPPRNRKKNRAVKVWPERREAEDPFCSYPKSVTGSPLYTLRGGGGEKEKYDGGERIEAAGPHSGTKHGVGTSSSGRSGKERHKLASKQKGRRGDQATSLKSP